MNQIKLVISLWVAMIVVGCSTPNIVAYKTVGPFAVGVNTALKVYNDFYQAGKSSEEERLQVKAAYEKYQATARIAENIQKNYALTPDGVDIYQKAVDIVASSANDLVYLVETLTKGK